MLKNRLIYIIVSVIKLKKRLLKGTERILKGNHSAHTHCINKQKKQKNPLTY